MLHKLLLLSCVLVSLDMYDQIYIQHMGRLLTTWKTDDQSTKTPLQEAGLGNMTAVLTRNVYPTLD